MNTFLAFQRLEGQLRNEIEYSISSRLNQIMGELSSELLNVERALNAADVVVRLDAQPNQIQEFFSDVLKHNSSFLAMFLGRTPTDVVYANRFFAWDTPVDPTTRPWYQAAVREGNFIFTGPYVDAAQGSLVLTMAKPVYSEDGKLLGVIGIDKSLEGMLDALELAKPSENGYALAFNRSGERLFSAEQGQGAQELVISNEIIGSLLSNPNGIISAEVNGQSGYLKWNEVGNSGIVLATFAPLSDFLDGKTLALKVFHITVSTLVLVWLLLFWFQRRYIIKPLNELDQDIMAISLEEDISYRLPVRMQNPFGELRRAINRSLSKAQEQFEQVIYQQEELTAAYSQLVAHEKQLQSQYNEIKTQQAQIRFLAEHDPLTSLLRRERFEEDLEKHLTSGGSGSVVLFDIDDFKKINDTQGHVYGDEILSFVAGVLKVVLPQGCQAYRFGGDEFLLVLQNAVKPDEVMELIERLSESFAQQEQAGRRKHLTISWGVVRYPQDGQSVDELLSKVDLALHEAKRMGKNRVRFFEGSMKSAFSQRVQVETMLRGALESNGFALVYQPIVHAKTGEVAYFEALLRLQGQTISPSVFVAIAEETDLIHPIGRWVIREAIAQLASWQADGKPLRPIAINLSAKQFYDDGLVEFLEEQLIREKVDPSLLEMEITETVLIDNPHQAIKIIERIKALGVQMALDDFGTGYLAISYITHIPVDRIKLDGAMTQGLAENLQVMTGLITMAHGLNMDVVAEGVETVDQARLLAQVNCDYLQGYLFSKPIPAEEAVALLSVTDTLNN